MDLQQIYNRVGHWLLRPSQNKSNQTKERKEKPSVIEVEIFVVTVGCLVW